MILENPDGTKKLVFDISRLEDLTDLEKSNSITSGGNITQIISGDRFLAPERIRMTGLEFKALRELVNDGSQGYFYTPTILPTYIDITKFPMLVSVGPWKRVKKYGAGNIYVITMDFIGIEFL